MKFSQCFIPTLREAPSDAAIASHRLMMRAGMIRRLGNGLFAYLPLGLRSFRKLERIIREEMDAAGCLEVKPTVVVPGDLWKESGRWNTMGDALLRAQNRLGDDLVISPTAEEAVTALARGELSSYRQLPLNLYQINTKYRDEVRPRYGVMRAREFTMKDGYSFHADEESLAAAYNGMEKAYRRIFRRCGLSVILVKADSGAMGGSASEEFMVESAVGDNTLLICKQCDYAANVEKAACKPDFTAMTADEAKAAAPASAIEKIATPDVKSIAELCAFLKTDAKSFIKTLIYRAVNVGIPLDNAPGQPKNAVRDANGLLPEAFFAVCIRGDLEVNEAKLASLLKASEVRLASDADVVRITGAPVGFAGPVGLGSVPVIADGTVSAMTDAVTGALEKDAHFRHVCFGRDFEPWLVADVRTAKEGDRCAVCGGELYEKKGNELGHIFKLGRKYTDALGVNCLGADGKPLVPLMGTYGIGLDRTLACVIEERHDEAGIVWPLSLAPFHVFVVPVQHEGELMDAAEALHKHLEKAGVEALLDDRNERAGVKFNDGDLIGIPFRVVIGGKNLRSDPPLAEVKRRGSPDTRLVPIADIPSLIAAEIKSEMAALNT